MFLGAVAWYCGLAAGGIARVGQLNLVQPLLALLCSAILLGERVTWPFSMTAIVVIIAMVVCIKSRVAMVRRWAVPRGLDSAADVVRDAQDGRCRPLGVA